MYRRKDSADTFSQDNSQCAIIDILFNREGSVKQRQIYRVSKHSFQRQDIHDQHAQHCTAACR